MASFEAMLRFTTTRGRTMWVCERMPFNGRLRFLGRFMQSEKSLQITRSRRVGQLLCCKLKMSTTMGVGDLACLDLYCLIPKFLFYSRDLWIYARTDTRFSRIGRRGFPCVPLAFWALVADSVADYFKVIPTMDNDPGMYRNLVGSTNIYGEQPNISALYSLHNWPLLQELMPTRSVSLCLIQKDQTDTPMLGFNCSTPTIWRDIPTTWRSYHESVNPEEPFFFPECVCLYSLAIDIISQAAC